MSAPPLLLSTTQISGTTTSITVPDKPNLSLVLTFWGAAYGTTAPSNTPFTASFDSVSLSRFANPSRSGTYNYGPACQPITYYYRISGAGFFLSRPNPGSHSLVMGGSPRTWQYGLAHVVQNAWPNADNFRSLSSGGGSSAAWSPLSTLSRNAILIAMVRPYRAGAESVHFNPVYVTVSPDTYYGNHYAQVGRAAPGYTSSWSPSEPYIGVGVWMSAKALVPLFAIGE